MTRISGERRGNRWKAVAMMLALESVDKGDLLDLVCKDLDRNLPLCLCCFAIHIDSLETLL